MAKAAKVVGNAYELKPYGHHFVNIARGMPSLWPGEGKTVQTNLENRDEIVAQTKFREKLVARGR